MMFKQSLKKLPADCLSADCQSADCLLGVIVSADCRTTLLVNMNPLHYSPRSRLKATQSLVVSLIAKCNNQLTRTSLISKKLLLKYEVK